MAVVGSIIMGCCPQLHWLTSDKLDARLGVSQRAGSEGGGGEITTQCDCSLQIRQGSVISNQCYLFRVIALWQGVDNSRFNSYEIDDVILSTSIFTQ